MNQRMASLALAAILVFIAVGVLPANHVAATESMSRPVWTAGDHWAYRVELFDRAGPLARGAMDASVLGEENLTVRGLVYATYHVRIATSLTPVAPHTGPNQSTMLEEWLTKDLVEVRSVTATGSGSNLVTREWTTVPPGDVPWPLSNGLHWNWTRTESLKTTTAGGETNLSTVITRQYGVESSSNVSVVVAAGAFEVFEVTERATAAASNETFWSPTVGQWVEQISTEDYGYLMTSRLQLTAYTYQAGREAPAGSSVWNLVWIAFLFAVVAVAIVVLLRSRRRHSLAPAPPPPGPDGVSPPPDSAGMPRPPLRP